MRELNENADYVLIHTEDGGDMILRILVNTYETIRLNICRRPQSISSRAWEPHISTNAKMFVEN